MADVGVMVLVTGTNEDIVELLFPKGENILGDEIELPVGDGAFVDCKVGGK